MGRQRRLPEWIAIGAACALLLGVAAVPGAAQGDPTDQLTVELDEDGDATVTTTSTFDLTDEPERRAFEELEADPEGPSATYAQRLRGIAEQVAADEGREMAVREPRVSVDRVDDVGVVELSVTWTNLVAVEGDRLVLSTPFDDGFQAERPLVVRAPDGYAIDEATVSPSEESDREARWDAGSDLSGFSATMAPSSGALALPLSVPIGAIALTAGGLAARRRRASA